MNANDYLKRIRSEHLKEVSLDNLKQLQKNHLSIIPFENLNLMINRKVKMNIDEIYSKVVNAHRGGFCFELNQLFEWLLRQLGYETKLVGCRVFGVQTKVYSPWLSHVATLVKLNQIEYLVDVGFSSCNQYPIEFKLDQIQTDLIGRLKIVQADEPNTSDCFTLLRCTSANLDEWTPMYQFINQSRDINEFNEMLQWVQSPECPRFFNRSLTIIHSSHGFLMLVGYRLTRIEFQDGVEISRTDTQLESKQQVYDTLRTEFNLKLDFEFEPIDLVN